jgi:hypothetical protein
VRQKNNKGASCNECSNNINKKEVKPGRPRQW